jgi:hypothetical protein
LFGQPSFQGMDRPNGIGLICLSFEEVAEHACDEVLMEVDSSIVLIVVDLLRILDQLLMFSVINIRNIITIILLIHYIKLYIIKTF